MKTPTFRNTSCDSARDSMTRFDPARVGLFTELFASVAEEMGAALERVSFSPNIKERRDYSCAVFDAEGRLIAQAAHIPVHLGAMEFLMRHWLAHGPSIEPDRLYVTNDPYFAGTHLPDISVIRSVEAGGLRVGYVASRAHHADIGGAAPGSIAPAKTIEEEGLVIPPQELTRRAADWIAASSRTPEERLGDLEAQRAAAAIGARRFGELAGRCGEALAARIEECLAYAEALTRAALRNIQAGAYRAENVIEGLPGPDPTARLRLSVTAPGDRTIRFDFADTDAPLPIGLNATVAVTRSACYYVVRCLAGDAPTNGGCWAPVTVAAPPGTLVNATHPAPVVAGNTETSQRIVDLILQALAPALPDRVPACSQGTMNNLALGADDWAYYETVAGGAGAGPARPGAHGAHTHMTNTRNTPVEALEIELPLRVRRYELRRGSGGAGRHTGGDGVVREIEVLAPDAILTLMTGRRDKGPPGAGGGEPGRPGRNTLIRGGARQALPSKGIVRLHAGDRIRVETPGGGGWGRAEAAVVE